MKNGNDLRSVPWKPEPSEINQKKPVGSLAGFVQRNHDKSVQLCVSLAVAITFGRNTQTLVSFPLTSWVLRVWCWNAKSLPRHQHARQRWQMWSNSTRAASMMKILWVQREMPIHYDWRMFYDLLIIILHNTSYIYQKYHLIILK